MGTLIAKLKEFLVEMIERSESVDVEACFIRKTGEKEQPDELVEALTTEDTMDLVERLANQLASPKKTDKNKKNDKARLCYFSLRINDFNL